MKKSIAIILIFSLNLLQTIAMSNPNISHKIKFSNKSDIGFKVQIIALSCDSSFVIPFIRVNGQDTTFEFESRYQNFIYTIINIQNTSQITTALFSESQELAVNFNFPLETESIIKTFSSIQFKGNNSSIEFGSIVNQLMIKAISQEHIDSNHFIKSFNKLFEKNPRNLLALWFEYNLLGPKDSIRKEEVREQIMDCRGYSAILFPSNKKKSKIKFQTAEMKYDTFLNYLTNNVKPGKGLSKPKFDSDTCYLIFWASWCGPCIQQIKAMAPEEYSNPNTYFISVDSEVSNGISRAEKLGIQKRLFFMPPDILDILGYKTIPLHLILIKNERKVLEE